MLTLAILSEDNHLSIAEVTVEGLGDVESGILLGQDGSGRGAHCSSEGRKEGDHASRNHVGQIVGMFETREG